LAVAKKELLAPDERELKAFSMVKKIREVPPCLSAIVAFEGAGTVSRSQRQLLARGAMTK